MKTYKLRQLAKDDLEEIWLYSLENHSITQAEKYTTALENRFQWLADNPKFGTPRDEIGEGYRNWKQDKHNIFYRIAGHDIEIIGLVGDRMVLERHLIPEQTHTKEILEHDEPVQEIEIDDLER